MNHREVALPSDHFPVTLNLSCCSIPHAMGETVKEVDLCLLSAIASRKTLSSAFVGHVRNVSAEDYFCDVNLACKHGFDAMRAAQRPYLPSQLWLRSLRSGVGRFHESV